MYKSITKVAMATVISLAAFGPSALWADSQDYLKIGVIFPTRNVIGTQAVAGAELARDMINEAGGVLGQQLKLIIYDTNFSPVDGVAAVQRLLSEDGVRYISGEIGSTVALAAIPVIKGEEALAIFAIPKHPDVTASGYDRIFRLNSTTSMDAASFNSFLVDEIAPKSVAMVGENSDFGLLSIENMKGLFGEKLVYSDTFAVQQSDFSAIASNIRAADPDLVCIAASNPEQSANLLRSMADLGFEAERCLMPGLLNLDLPRLAGAAAEGVFSEDVYMPSIDTELNRQFVEAYVAKHDVEPGKIEVLAFEGIWILAKAIEMAGDANDVAEVQKALSSQEFITPRGPITFDENGQGNSKVKFRITVRDGALVELGN